MMDCNDKSEAKDNRRVNIPCKPIIVPGLVYRTIVSGGFQQLIKREDMESIQFNTAKQEIPKKLEVPPEVFSDWMKNGSINYDTYILLRNYALKKNCQKRMAFRKEIEEAERMISAVKVASFQTIMRGEDSLTSKEQHEEVDFSFRQAIFGMVFGLAAARIFCLSYSKCFHPN